MVEPGMPCVGSGSALVFPTTLDSTEWVLLAVAVFVAGG